jgi:hypothetical protein
VIAPHPGHGADVVLPGAASLEGAEEKRLVGLDDAAELPRHLGGQDRKKPVPAAKGRRPVDTGLLLELPERTVLHESPRQRNPFLDAREPEKAVPVSAVKCRRQPSFRHWKR